MTYFQQKLGLLNRNFLSFLSDAIRKTPNADFSPTVRDYLKHVSDLDDMYSKPSDPKKPRIATADESSTPTVTVTSKCGILKTPASIESKANGSSSTTKKVTFGGEETSEEAEKKRAAKVREVLEQEEKSRTNFKPENLRASRKRSKFGGEEDESSETVTFKARADQGHELAEKAATLAPPVIPDFLKKAQSDGASFWKKKAEPTTPEKPTEPVKEHEKTMNESSESPMNFGDKPTAPASSLFSFGATSVPVSSPMLGATTNGSEKKANGPLFAFLKPPTQPVDASSSNGQNDATDETDEPPKVEAVVNDEPGTIFMTKCGVHVFKNKSYMKLGIGTLYLKKDSEESDSDVPEVFLMRAATATGTIWANARLKNVTLKDLAELKVNILVPNTEGTMQTLLVKLPSQESKKQLIEYLSQK